MQAMRGSATLPAATELQPWITPSHRRRLLEVLFARPRPETLLVVNAVLENNLASTVEQVESKAA